MDDTKILEKAIEKAKKNGYVLSEDKKEMFFIEDEIISFRYPYLYYDEEGAGTWVCHINEIIFDHSFAKAFFGKNKICVGAHNLGHSECTCDCWDMSEHVFIWKYHLQEMVLEEEPLKYLEQFI